MLRLVEKEKEPKGVRAVRPWVGSRHFCVLCDKGTNKDDALSALPLAEGEYVALIQVKEFKEYVQYCAFTERPGEEDPS